MLVALCSGMPYHLEMLVALCSGMPIIIICKKTLSYSECDTAQNLLIETARSLKKIRSRKCLINMHLLAI